LREKAIQATDKHNRLPCHVNFLATAAASMHVRYIQCVFAVATPAPARRSVFICLHRRGSEEHGPFAPPRDQPDRGMHSDTLFCTEAIEAPHGVNVVWRADLVAVVAGGRDPAMRECTFIKANYCVTTETKAFTPPPACAKMLIIKKCSEPQRERFRWCPVEYQIWPFAFLD
jgi:hypothetical protein